MDHNLYQGGIGGPQMHDEGAVYSGKGKYQLHFLGTEKPKELTRRVIIAVVAIVLAVLAITTLLAGKQPKDFPYEAKLRNAIGESLEAAAAEAGVKVADMTEIEPGVYLSGRKIKLDGVTFDLYFYGNDGICSGFAYYAEYQADAKKAAKDIGNTFINLQIKTFVPNGETEPVPVNLKNLQNELAKEVPLRIRHSADMTPSDMVIDTAAVLYMDEGCGYDPETQRLQLVLSYRLEPKRNNKGYYD